MTPEEKELNERLPEISKRPAFQQGGIADNALTQGAQHPHGLGPETKARKTRSDTGKLRIDLTPASAKVFAEIAFQRGDYAVASELCAALSRSKEA